MRAIIEPTDRSMPLVMMTRPAPRLKMPNRPIMFAMFTRLVSEKKRGFSNPVTAHITTSKIKMPSSFFIFKLNR